MSKIKEIYMSIESEYLRELIVRYLRKKISYTELENGNFKFFDNNSVDINEFINSLYAQNENIAVGIHFDDKYEKKFREIIPIIYEEFSKLSDEDKENIILFMSRRKSSRDFYLYR